MRKKILLTLLILLSSLSLYGCSFALRAEVPYTSPATYEQARIEMIQTVVPSVIAVKTETGHGSGIIYHSEPILESDETLYYALTNNHVVKDGGEMKIHFGNDALDIPVYDYATYEAYDIAVVRFKTNRVLRVHAIAPINDNSITEIVKGQDVYAIGTPEDISRFNYVTQGIISLASYPYNGITDLGIMHDAELNPGNSGGPLFNLKGEVIGINVAKVPTISTKDGVIAAEGLNYSLSINKLAPIIRSFGPLDYNIIVRKARLGVTVQEVSIFLQDHSADLLPPNPVGVVVVGLDSTRNAIDVIELYDLIIKIDGDNVTSLEDISSHLTNAQFGQEHSVTVLRKTGTTFTEFTYTIALS